MDGKTQNRVLNILKYLWENTDEEHFTTNAELVEYLSTLGIETNNKTVAKDIVMLTEFGVDIISERSTQNRYFIGSRIFELAEVKMMVDAIQSARFIPEKKTNELFWKLSCLASKYQVDALRRNLVTSKAKGDNNRFLYTVDMLNTAINQRKQVRFQYIDYDKDGKKTLKYNGYTYKYSPIAIVWNMDSYYVAGFSKKHDAIIKFKIDKITNLSISDEDSVPVPEDLNLSETFQKMFLMYGDKEERVTLLCDNDVMNKIIDRFGEGVEVTRIDDEHFEVSETVMVGSTFYSWVVNYCGKIKITSPEWVKEDFKALLHKFDE